MNPVSVAGCQMGTFKKWQKMTKGFWKNDKKQQKSDTCAIKMTAHGCINKHVEYIQVS